MALSYTGFASTVPFGAGSLRGITKASKVPLTSGLAMPAVSCAMSMPVRYFAR
jgi:hypothetical protein